jgi:hypothetical protein
MTTKAASKSLLASLAEERERLLQHQGIYRTLDYGWEDHDTPSGEYLGLAIWISDAPYESAWHRVFGGRDTPPPSPREIAFLRTGEDFVGTMDLARNAIGTSLYALVHTDFVDIHDEQFWEWHAISAQWLSIASDRLREYFVMARFGLTERAFKKQYRDLRDFSAPFKHHVNGEGPTTLESAKTLIALTEELQEYRHKRHEIVHEVASRAAEVALDLIHSEVQGAAPAGVKCDPAAWHSIEADIARTRRTELNTAFETLRKWYFTLVRAGGLTFEFEYWKRLGR